MPAAARREQLLDAVLHVIVEQGVHKVSIDVVAREVGVTRPVVYSVFADSDALLRASLDREERGALAQVAAVLEVVGRADPDQRIAVLIREFLAAVQHAPERWRAVLMLADSSTPAFRKRLDRGREAVIATLTDIVGERPDTELTAYALRGYLFDAGRLTLAAHDRFPVDRLVEFGARTFGRH